MASPLEAPLSRFEKEVLSSMNQINTNVHTLIQVFMNIESFFSIANNNNNKMSPTNMINNNCHTADTTNHISEVDIKTDDIVTNNQEHKDQNNNNNITNNSNGNNDNTNDIHTNSNEENANKIPTQIPNKLTVIDTHSEPIKAVKFNDSANGNANDNDDDNSTNNNNIHGITRQIESENGVILSLDSSDTDDDDKYSNDNPKSKMKNIKLKSRNKSACHVWRSPHHSHRSKFGLNRSKSTGVFHFNPSSQTNYSSMNALLKRNHKYNGLMMNKHKYRKKDDKNDKNNKRNHHKKHHTLNAPKFNPSHIFLSQNNRTVINVGGSIFETTLNTVAADQSSMLSALFSGRFEIERDENGSIFIDRDPTHFRHILNFLRDGIEYLKHGGLLQQPDAIIHELLQEAKFYNIRPLVDYIQLQQTKKTKRKGDELTHEKQYKLVTNVSIQDFDETFNKFTGSAGYDFENWIYVQPYKASRNNTSSPSFQMLFSKKLSRAEVRLLDRLTNIDFQ